MKMNTLPELGWRATWDVAGMAYEVAVRTKAAAGILIRGVESSDQESAPGAELTPDCTINGVAISNFDDDPDYFAVIKEGPVTGQSVFEPASIRG